MDNKNVREEITASLVDAIKTGSTATCQEENTQPLTHAKRNGYDVVRVL